MKTETEIREMLKILEYFNVQFEVVKALRWVLGEYPPPKAPALPVAQDLAPLSDGGLSKSEGGK